MSTQLEQIAAKAKADRTLRFTSLAHLLTPAFLIETWRQMNRRGASGVDGETTTEFERELETRVQDICARLKAGTYRAPPVRRVEIPKGPGKVGTRPLGIPTVEDRLVQRAVARIVEAVFEADFLDCSYGFRPRRSAHHAWRTLRATLVTKKVRHLYEADIRGYFNHINHQWLMRMVAHRIADGVILRLIGKWLRAGVMHDGVVIRTEAGTPQGGPLTPRTQKVTSAVIDLIRCVRVRRSASIRRSGWHGNTVADDDRVVIDQHLLDDQPHDALTFDHVEGLGGHAHPRQKRRECLCETEIRCPLARLIRDRLQLGAQCLFALAQEWHPLAQLLQRQQVFLIRGQHALDALPDTEQIAVQRLLALPCRVGGASHGKPAIQFLLNQRGTLEQPNDLRPDDLIQEVLAHGSAVAAWSAEMAPRIRANTAIVVDQARARPRRRARERVATPPAADQPLHKTGLNRSSPRPDFVVVQQFLRAGERRFVNERRNGNLDPLLARPLTGSLTARDPGASRDIDTPSGAFRLPPQRRHPGGRCFRGSIPGPHVPLSTLRRHPRG
jgi:retron-type reverse transcriptase